MDERSAPAGDGGDELLLPDLLLAAAFSRRAGSTGPVDRLDSGRELGGYRILHRLGAGGMGTVYVAEQRNPRRRVALKLLTPSGSTRALLRRFQQEAELLGSLQHPGIAQIHEAGTVELEGLGVPLHFLALELVEGLPLDEWARERELDLPARLELLARVCDALEHAHQRGVVHRDLKPANVLVTDDGLGGPGQPKVLDFGVARVLESESQTGANTRVTLEGQLVGTLAYMSPEQAAGDLAAIDARSDVYALGVLLYRLLCGSVPIEVGGLSLAEAVLRIRTRVPERPSRRERGLPTELDTIVSGALAKDRDERYASAAELAGDLRRHLRGEPILAREHSALYLIAKLLRRHRLLVGSAFTIVLLVLAFALFAGVQARRNRALADSVGLTRDALARELRRSNLDRARLFAMAGHLQKAEDLLWGELAHSAGAQDVLWGLRDLYRRFPCLATHELSERATYEFVALPDGRLVSLGYDGELREHAPPDFAPRASGFRAEHGTQRLRLTPDGRHLVHLDVRRMLSVLDARSLEVRFAFDLGSGASSGHEGNALACPADDLAWVGLDDGRLLEVELGTDGEQHTFAEVGAPVRDLELAPGGLRLALGLADGSVVLWDLTRATPLWRTAPTGLEVRRMVFDRAGERLYAGGVDRRVRVIDCADGAQLEEWSAPNGTIRQIELDPPRARALVSGWWSLDEWSLDGARRRVRLRHPTECFQLVEDGTVLVTAGSLQVRAWEARVIQDPRPLVRAEGRSVAVFLGEGELALVGDEAGRLCAVETATGAVRWSAPVLDRRIRAIAVGGGGEWALVAGEAGRALRVDARDGRVVGSFGPVRALTRGSLALHPDGRRVAHGERPGSVIVRDLEARAPHVRIALLGDVGGLAWSPDGTRLAIVDRGRGLVLFDAAGNELRALEDRGALWMPSFAPDGDALVVSTWAGELLQVDARTLEVLAVLEGHTATPWDLAFPAGESQRVLSASGDGSVRLWDLEEGRALVVLDELEGWEALSVDVAAAGRRLLLASSTGAVHAIDLADADRCIVGNLPHQTGRLARLGHSDAGDDAWERDVRAALTRRGW